MENTANGDSASSFPPSFPSSVITQQQPSSSISSSNFSLPPNNETTSNYFNQSSASSSSSTTIVTTTDSRNSNLGRFFQRFAFNPHNNQSNFNNNNRFNGLNGLNGSHDSGFDKSKYEKNDKDEKDSKHVDINMFKISSDVCLNVVEHEIMAATNENLDSHMEIFKTNEKCLVYGCDYVPSPSKPIYDGISRFGKIAGINTNTNTNTNINMNMNVRSRMNGGMNGSTNCGMMIINTYGTIYMIHDRLNGCTRYDTVIPFQEYIMVVDSQEKSPRYRVQLFKCGDCVYRCRHYRLNDCAIPPPLLDKLQPITPPRHIKPWLKVLQEEKEKQEEMCPIVPTLKEIKGQKDVKTGEMTWVWERLATNDIHDKNEIWSQLRDLWLNSIARRNGSEPSWRWPLQAFTYHLMVGLMAYTNKSISTLENIILPHMGLLRQFLLCMPLQRAFLLNAIVTFANNGGGQGQGYSWLPTLARFVQIVSSHGLLTIKDMHYCMKLAKTINNANEWFIKHIKSPDPILAQKYAPYLFLTNNQKRFQISSLSSPPPQPQPRPQPVTTYFPTQMKRQETDNDMENLINTMPPEFNYEPSTDTESKDCQSNDQIAMANSNSTNSKKDSSTDEYIYETVKCPIVSLEQLGEPLPVIRKRKRDGLIENNNDKKDEKDDEKEDRFGRKRRRISDEGTENVGAVDSGYEMIDGYHMVGDTCANKLDCSEVKELAAKLNEIPSPKTNDESDSDAEVKIDDEDGDEDDDEDATEDDDQDNGTDEDTLSPISKSERRRRKRLPDSESDEVTDNEKDNEIEDPFTMNY